MTEENCVFFVYFFLSKNHEKGSIKSILWGLSTVWAHLISYNWLRVRIRPKHLYPGFSRQEYIWHFFFSRYLSDKSYNEIQIFKNTSLFETIFSVNIGREQLSVVFIRSDPDQGWETDPVLLWIRFFFGSGSVLSQVRISSLLEGPDLVNLNPDPQPWAWEA